MWNNTGKYVSRGQTKKRMHERIKEKLIQQWIEKNQKTIGLKVLNKM